MTEAAWFRRSIIAVIALAGITAGAETDRAFAERHRPALAILDAAIVLFFALEAALKILAHGPRPLNYFRDPWNTFDFSILILCLIPAGGPFTAVLRLARALRLLRLVSALPKLQLLVGALLKSLSAMGYVTLLLGLLFYVYAVAGVHLYGGTDQENFGSLPIALLTLFRVVTLDNWGDIFLKQLATVHALKVTVYFVTFIVFGTMIILNLFIGIIMNSMAEMHEEIEKAGASTAPKAGTPSTLADELEELQRESESLNRKIARTLARAREENPAGDPLAKNAA